MLILGLVTWAGLVAATGDEREVRMGQVHYEELELEELLGAVRGGHATLALVELATPEHVERAYPVPGGRGKTCPPYDFIEYRATIRKVVRAGRSHPALAVDGPVAIVPANVPDLVDLSHRACVEGGSKSPIWPSFRGARPGPGLRLLVVLRHTEQYGFLESVSGAWLPESDLPRIEKLLATPAP